MSLGWRIRECLPPLTVLLFRNSTNFAKLNTTEVNQNTLVANISTCKKTKISKLDKKKEKQTL